MSDDRGNDGRGQDGPGNDHRRKGDRSTGATGARAGAGAAEAGPVLGTAAGSADVPAAEPVDAPAVGSVGAPAAGSVDEPAADPVDGTAAEPVDASAAGPAGGSVDATGNEGADDGFVGAKLALFVGGALVVIRRDEGKPIPWPGFLDFPGGGREGGETALECALRETREEVGLAVAEAEVVWRRRYERPHGTVWFFAARLAEERAAEIVLGDEGQDWRLMTAEAYMADPAGIPHFKAHLRDYLTTNPPPA